MPRNIQELIAYAHRMPAECESDPIPVTIEEYDAAQDWIASQSRIPRTRFRRGKRLRGLAEVRLLGHRLEVV